MAAVVGRSVTVYGQGGYQTDLDLDTIGEPDVAEVIPDLLANYAAECKDWTIFAGEHWRQKRWDRATELITKAIQHFRSDPVALSRLHTMAAHLQLALARNAPKAVIQYTKYDKLDPKLPVKEYYYTEATVHLNKANEANQAAGGSEEPTPLTLGKILLYLARGQPAAAHPMVDQLLARQPTNLVALLAQARLQFARRAHSAAFETYQRVLGLNPDLSPDPRIGLGICAWVAGDKVRAKLAWEKTLKREPTAWVPLLLLGLSALNTARDPSVAHSARLEAEAEGVSYVQRAFKLNTNSPASAIALASVTGQQAGKIAVASKLAERAIQYADNKRHSTLANAERGRLGYVAGDLGDAGPFISAAKTEEQGVNVLAELTLGQMAIKSGNLREALNYIEQTAKRLPSGGPLEFTVLHASLLNYPHPGMTNDELARNRQTARTMLSNLHKQFVELRSSAPGGPDEAATRLRIVGQDPEIFLELGKMWMEESLDKAAEAYQAAVAIATELEDGAVGPNGAAVGAGVNMKTLKMSTNLGALYQLQGNVETAERMYQDALSRVAGAGEEGQAALKGSKTAIEMEQMKTVLAFNLGRAYEEQGETAQAGQWYRDVLRQHPEHMESKVRLAAIAASQGRNVDAHNLLKECLKADESSLVLRSVYTHFLISLSSFREALSFTTATLKFESKDPYTFCALGWLHFTLGREAKSSSEVAERSKQYLRSGEAYERALALDGTCAMAAQGLAILLAEDALLLPDKIKGRGAEEELKSRQRAAGAALSVLSRINDSVVDGSTSVNMGHCYFVRNEEEKAIQAYEAAENHFKGRNVSNLLYLSRAWYAYATRDSNYSAMGKSLGYAQRAMHIQPSDRAILYNIAMIQQKAAEMLLSLDPAKRTLEELQAAVSQAQHAASTFRALADDKVKPLPYDVDLADQRARYGDGLLRKAPEQIERQRVFEGEAAARVEEARRVRAAEEEKIRLAQEARAKELADKQALIAAAREEARLTQEAFQRELQARHDEDAEEKRQKAERVAEKRRRREAGEDVDGPSAPREKKKREGGGSKKKKEPRKGRSRSEVPTDSDPDTDPELERSASQTPAGDEEEDVEVRRQRTLAKLKAKQEKNKKKNKRADPDADEDEAPRKARKGNFKSADTIEDSDEEADAYDQDQATESATRDQTAGAASEGEGESEDANGASPVNGTAADEDGTPAAEGGLESAELTAPNTATASDPEGNAGEPTRSPTPERSPTPPPREGGDMDVDDDDY